MYDMYGVRIIVNGLAPSSLVKDLRTKLELYLLDQKKKLELYPQLSALSANENRT